MKTCLKYNEKISFIFILTDLSIVRLFFLSTSKYMIEQNSFQKCTKKTVELERNHQNCSNKAKF